MEKNLEKDIYYVLLFSRQVASDLFVTPWTVARQDPLFMGFPRQEYWNGLLFPPPGESSQPRDLPNLGIGPWKTDSLPLSHQGSPCIYINKSLC